ncbi:cysteine hydrolase family protein [Paenibacillus profundus]|uniref:cysteine hydrolase family protein n=1 Tax=Paenibacillus profundus TaxID=1173085 RepID=UPI003898E4FC
MLACTVGAFLASVNGSTWSVQSITIYADYVLEKQTPSSFYKTELSKTLERLSVKHLFITGFNTEFCCMFTAISGFDRSNDIDYYYQYCYNKIVN